MDRRNPFSSPHPNRHKSPSRPSNGRYASDMVRTSSVQPQESVVHSRASFEPKTIRSTERWRRIIIPAIITATILAGVIGAYLLLRPDSPIPNDIKRQISFGVFYIKDKAILDIDRSSMSYDSSTEVLSFKGKLPSGLEVNFSQQATPESFVDIPQVYEKLITSLQPYSSFDSINGKVSLTHPKELRGGQTAVLNDQGTLMFVRPDKGLDNTEWRRLFNNMYLHQ